MTGRGETAGQHLETIVGDKSKMVWVVFLHHPHTDLLLPVFGKEYAVKEFDRL
jgi:hypothetical protein